MRWRLLLTPPMTGAENMGLDVALMDRARRTGETVLRLYSWRRPTLTLGRNQRAAGQYDPRALAELRLDVVRRPTGGRALLHGKDLTYSVTAPATRTLGDSYARINSLLVNALTALGVPAEFARPCGRSVRPDTTPCFAEAAAGEIVVSGRKLAGSAQWRHDDAILQQGSILMEDDQPVLARCMAGAAVPSPVAATLRGALGREVTLEEFGAQALSSVRALEDAEARWFTLESAVMERGQLLAAHHADPAWTWRR